MPIYEYRRQDGSTFELLESITAEPLTVDPETGQPVERVLHAPAVHFKGSGFYNTDYGTRKRQRENRESGEGGDKGAAKGKDKAGEKKGESKASASGSSSSGSSSSSASSD
jgi:putative FmdB family regulatory protein